MNKEEVDRLDNGVYRLYWRDGRSSLASIGDGVGGYKWFSATDWDKTGTTDLHWRCVERAETLHTDNPTTSVDRFKLEDQMTQCSSILEDLTLIGEVCVDDKVEIVNAIKLLYTAKFDRMFETFNQLVEDNKL